MIDNTHKEKAAAVAVKVEIVAKQTGKTPDQVLDAAKDAAGIGHNSDDIYDVGGIAGTRLLSFIERVERREEEKAALMDDIKEVYAEAKGVGFDVKAIRKLIKMRKMDREKLSEEQEIIKLYASAIGMQGYLF